MNPHLQHVTLGQISEWYNRTRVPPHLYSESRFQQFCEKTYAKFLEIANSTGSLGVSWIAVGLLGVGVVPLVQKVFYNQVIQYLVALAVGTLTGDAMLHLLPHAIAAGEGHSHDPDEADKERVAVYKGLVALGGVYIFFLAEKLLGYISEYRAEKKLEKNKLSNQLKSYSQEDREKAMQNPRRSMEVRRLSTFRPSITPGSLTVPNQPRRLSSLDPSACRRASRAMSIANEDILTTGLSSKAMRNIDILYRYAEEDAELEEKYSDQEHDDNDTHLSVTRNSLRVEDGLRKSPTLEKKSDGQHVTTGATLADHHEHSHEEDKKKHGHGHSHEVPGSVASVAWMVIMGDGLHNFTDGMAIGAAFAQSISGGLSTTVAVFCHELPHELGDFAVLLKTGMRIKEALFFNVVSSILSLFGMLVGIAVGNVESASYWIFAVTAGTFMYIALVDMLPELSTAELRPGQTRVGQFFIQTFGLATGVGIMLCIAIFEDKILVMID
ncbi:Zinc transporter foi [Fasciolopsis buskii]|uniref:Zinc transporter foi n=1 Tax=Fasciolopsis buskii TaxID=27845 RepID=A0A8E0S8N1_9TREM|nr:Zinc transporter foi [Fasciolopsis buski]